ncbi:MAG: 50S ribosomal protein L11 methyltransferase [Burkholderiaceae bacterium]
MLREVSLLADEAYAESLADALIEAGALSVSVEDADADSDAEQPLYGEPGLEPTRLAWNRSRLTILIDADFELESTLEEAAAALGCAIPSIDSQSEVADTDWVRQTQAQFPPTQISERLWIVPTWHEPPQAAAINIRLDPGVAFGTGTHPTTRLCLMWLDQSIAGGETLLDYGCGSGILAIAAKKLGAGESVGTDIDPQAIEAARLNAADNDAEVEFVLPDDFAAGEFNVVVANILSNPLKLLAPALLGRVAPGGALVLSGVLERQAEEVIAAYAAIDPGLLLSVWRAEDGWVCLAGRRA